MQKSYAIARDKERGSRPATPYPSISLSAALRAVPDAAPASAAEPVWAAPRASARGRGALQPAAPGALRVPGPDGQGPRDAAAAQPDERARCVRPEAWEPGA